LDSGASINAQQVDGMVRAWYLVRPEDNSEVIDLAKSQPLYMNFKVRRDSEAAK